MHAHRYFISATLFLAVQLWIRDAFALADEGWRHGAPTCMPADSVALLGQHDPAYADAMALASTLRSGGLDVLCLLRSKMVRMFDEAEGAAVYRTTAGDFDVVFLPKPRDFSRLRVTAWREGGAYVYSFRGPPRPWSANRMERTAGPLRFLPYRNALFVLSDGALATTLARIIAAESPSAANPPM